MNPATFATETPDSNNPDSSSSTKVAADVVVVIPALNEEESLPLVLGDLPETKGVIVVDNGSSDRTGEVAEANGAIVVREEKRGYGSACLRGLE